ncbi:Alpha/Beta hydrolase protein [Lentinula raphanica]|uniref:Alpha/Beta hydrolase protein n=1 Tax=Lentinula raphanica TaxID=153919 RepID=A0AA38PFB3_9AGAR|nr:Alpha/Beta hydrolase protein [Lentinula raphanica]
MLFSLRHQPLKALYLTFDFVGTVLVRAPLWLLLSIPKRWRPRASWSIKDTFLIQLLHHLVSVRAKTSPNETHSQCEGVDCIWVDPVPKLIVGDLAIWSQAASVSSEHVQGYWYNKNNIATSSKLVLSDERILYSLHGGAYTSGTAHPSGTNAKLVRTIMHLDSSINRAFAIEYRLSSNASNPFPAALVDALAGYNYLVNLGFNPANIIIQGSASGGNLALALIRYLIDYYGHSEVPDLPDVPGSLLLLSPWTDIQLATDESYLETTSSTTNATSGLVSDYMFGPHCPLTNFSKQVFLGPHGIDVAALNEYISPSSRHPLVQLDFEDFPRTFISAGAAENLLPQIHLLRDRMVRGLDNDDKRSEKRGKLTYHEASDASHNCLVLPFAIQEKARRDLLAAIGDWLSNHDTDYVDLACSY